MEKIKNYLSKITAYLQKNNYDGRLVYDFQGRNNIAVNLFQSKMTTRRWMGFVDKEGKMTFLVSHMEKSLFEDLSPNILTYITNDEYLDGLKKLLTGVQRVCMEYSAMGILPSICYVDAGTIELVKSLGIEVYSSATLVQMCNAGWGGLSGIKSHTQALDVLHRCMDYVQQKIKLDISQKGFSDEYDVQQGIMNILSENGMETNHPCIVAVDPNNANPHYFPTHDRTSSIRVGNLVMVDIWCRQKNTDSIYADITWMFFVGNTLPDEVQIAWNSLKKARDLGLEFIKDNISTNIVRGCDVDKVVRDVLIDDGFGEYFTHRTGHSIQHEDHAEGVNIDSYEILDDRELIDDCGFSIEPGIYIPQKFGMRTEFDVYIEGNEPRVFGPIQSDIILIN